MAKSNATRMAARAFMEQLERTSRGEDCSFDIGGVPNWDELRAFMEQVETASRGADRSFDIGGVPNWDELRAFMEQTSFRARAGRPRAEVTASSNGRLWGALLAAAAIAWSISTNVTVRGGFGSIPFNSVTEPVTGLTLARLRQRRPQFGRFECFLAGRGDATHCFR